MLNGKTCIYHTLQKSLSRAVGCNAVFGQPLAIYKQLASSTALDECFLHLNNSEPFEFNIE